MQRHKSQVKEKKARWKQSSAVFLGGRGGSDSQTNVKRQMFEWKVEEHTCERGTQRGGTNAAAAPSLLCLCRGRGGVFLPVLALQSQRRVHNTDCINGCLNSSFRLSIIATDRDKLKSYSNHSLNP